MSNRKSLIHDTAPDWHGAYRNTGWIDAVTANPDGSGYVIHGEEMDFIGAPHLYQIAHELAKGTRVCVRLPA